MERIAAGLKRLSKRKHECGGEDCGICRWFDDDELGPGKYAFKASFELYESAKENNMLHALVGPGACFALYHGPERVRLEDASPEDRETFLRMLISRQGSRIFNDGSILGKLTNQEGTGYLDEYGTVETLQFILKKREGKVYIDWVRRAITNFPLDRDILEAILGDCTILPYVYDLLAPMGDRLYNHCSFRGFKNLKKLDHPNPERYVKRLIEEIDEDNKDRTFPCAAEQPTMEKAMEYFDQVRKGWRRSDKIAEIREASSGLNLEELFEHAEQFGLEWLVVPSEGREHLAKKICQVDPEIVPERLASCSPKERLYRMASEGFLVLKAGLRPPKARF